MASVFSGQVFHSPPDLTYFGKHSRKMGKDETAYLKAVQAIPVISRERMPEIVGFLVELAEMLGRKGFARSRQLGAEEELRRLNQDLSRRVEERTEELEEKNRQLCLEVAEHQRAEAAVREEKQFSDDIINSLPGIFYMLDTDGRFARWNRKFSEVSGYSGNELAQMYALQLFDDDVAPIVQDRIREVFERGESAVEAPLVTKGMQRISHYFTGHRTLIGKRPYLVGLGIDITARKALEAELEKQAHEDFLTGVTTRRRFLELAEMELVRARRYGGALSVLMLDLDRFKEINDRHGHGVGDQALQQLARVCRTTLRAVDIIGRLGGDEFAIILPETDGEQVLQVAERLRQSIAAMEIACQDNGPLRFTASIGATTLRNADDSIEVLLSQADKALYQAKANGRNGVAGC